jgi:hypothetical protein
LHHFFGVKNGVVARLQRSSAAGPFIDEERPLSIRFSHSAHKNHRLAEAFTDSSRQILAEAQKSEDPETGMPGIRFGTGGPSIDIIEWARYLRDSIRKPKK